jgi:calcineurin-like phosphoesterase
VGSVWGMLNTFERATVMTHTHVVTAKLQILNNDVFIADKERKGIAQQLLSLAGWENKTLLTQK